jgi:hypothetical protein
MNTERIFDIMSMVERKTAAYVNFNVYRDGKGLNRTQGTPPLPLRFLGSSVVGSVLTWRRRSARNSCDHLHADLTVTVMNRSLQILTD